MRQRQQEEQQGRFSDTRERRPLKLGGRATTQSPPPKLIYIYNYRDS